MPHCVHHLVYLVLAVYMGVISSESAFFFPYGSLAGDELHPAVDDACSIRYEKEIKLFGALYSNIYASYKYHTIVTQVCTNGILSLNDSYTNYTPTSFPLKSSVGIIAPFWADADLRLGGNLWARVRTNDTPLQRNVSSAVSEVYREGFNATWVLVVTWEDVIAYGTKAIYGVNFYQCVVAVGNDGETYVLYLYGDIEWTNGTTLSDTPAQMGFDSGDGDNYYAHPASQTVEIMNIRYRSNIGATGQWMYKLDSEEVALPDYTTVTTPTTSLTSVQTSTTASTSTTTSAPAQAMTTATSTTTSAAVQTTTTASTSTSTTTSAPAETTTTASTSTIGPGTTGASSTTKFTANSASTGATQTTVATTGITQISVIVMSVSGIGLALLASVGMLLLYRVWKKKQQGPTIEMAMTNLEEGHQSMSDQELCFEQIVKDI